MSWEAVREILERFHGEHDTLSGMLQMQGAYLREILANQEKIMAAQDDINNAVTLMGTAVNAISAAVTALGMAPGTPVDTSGLTAATTQLATAVSGLIAATPPVTTAAGHVMGDGAAAVSHAAEPF